MEQNNVWETIDSLTVHSHEDFSNIESAECTVCSKNNNHVIYRCHIQQRGLDINFCQECFDKPIENILKIKDMNNTENNLVNSYYKCTFCKVPLQKLNKWYETKINYLTLHICETCYPTISNKLHQNTDFIDDKYILCQRSGDGIFLDISTVKDREIPDLLVKDVTKQRIDEWVELTSSIVNVTPLNNFGSLKSWVLFTDYYEIPFYDAMTYLLIECKKDSHRIASVVSDNHGRVSIDVIFDNIDDYITEYNQWLNSKIIDSNIYESKLNEVNESFKKSYSCSNKLLSEVCKEFSGYIRLQRGLNMYYG